MGSTYRCLMIGWVQPVILLVGVAFAAWLIERLHVVRTGGLFNVWKVLVVYAVLLILWQIWKARNRVVVEEFIDHTGGQDGSRAAGLSSLLVAELTHLHELYHCVDEQRAIGTAVKEGAAIDATITVDDTGELIRSAVSAESKLALGPLEIPVGSLFALVGYLTQGPRISGCLHQQNSRLILTAHMAGSGCTKCWRVDDPTPLRRPLTSEDRSLDDMVAELACRMFTDLTLGGAVRWRSTWAFNEGLRLYRKCLRTPRDRILNLKVAERMFIDALVEDERFAVAYYNLGVIYSELGQTGAAEVAFCKAIEEDPKRWEPYYALAWARQSQGKYYRVIELCDRVIALKPDSAQAYDLKGLAQRLRNQEEKSDLIESIESRRQAVDKSWKSLCRAERTSRTVGAAKGSMVTRHRQIASSCLRNLAVAYGYLSKMEDNTTPQGRKAYRSAVAVFEQAMFLDPSDAVLHFEFGKISESCGCIEDASRRFRAATQIESTNAEYWAHLGVVCARRNHNDEASRACERALDCASMITAGRQRDQILDNIASAYEQMGLATESQRVKNTKGLLKRLRQETQDKAAAITEMEADRRKYARAARRWEYAQVCYTLGRLYLTSSEFSKAEEMFQEAIDAFGDRYHLETRSLGLHALKARALRYQERYENALREAERAIFADPLSHYERVELGDVYYSVNDFQRAAEAWEDALRWRPDEPETHSRIGLAYVRQADCYHDPGRRCALLDKAAKHLRQTLELCEGGRREGRGQANYWLGRLHYMRREYEDAIRHFKIANSIGFAPSVTSLYLAASYLENKAYDDCEEMFERLIEQAGPEPTTGTDQRKALNTVVDSESGQPWYTGEILGLANALLAYSIAERDGDLQKAEDLTEQAKVHIDGLDDGRTRAQCEATNLDAQGWILCKKGDYKQAIERLQNAVAKRADAAIYFHLATACEQAVQQSQDDAVRQACISRAEACCKHVQEIDTTEHYSQLAKDLLARIQSP
jgi:tetratricopeptide (TPR) repeat protein